MVSPAELAARRPDAVLVFVPDLMAEVRGAYPEVEAAGGRWVDVEAHGSGGLQQDAQAGAVDPWMRPQRYNKYWVQIPLSQLEAS